MTTLSRSIVCVVALACGPAVVVGRQPGPVVSTASSSEMRDAGYRLLYSGDAAAAETHFRQAVATYPADLGLAFGLLISEFVRLDADEAKRPPFEAAIETYVDRAERQSAEQRDDPTALFYAAYGHTLRGLYRIEYDKSMWAAARDGAKARDEIDAYLKVRPDDGDAYLVRGMYDYWVDLAPTYARILRVLLFLPSGNRVDGLHSLERAAATGHLFGVAASLQLVGIYGFFEGRPADAVTLAEHLKAAWPGNDEVGFTLATVYTSPAVEERDKAAHEYETIVTRRRGDVTVDGREAWARAAYGLAGAEFDAWRCQDAVAGLDRIIASPPPGPAWLVPESLLRRGNDRMLMNDAGADADARRVLNDPGMKKWHGDATDLLKAIDRHRQSGEAPMYAALIPANRLVVEGRWDEAARAYDAVAAGHAEDVQIRYRRAYLAFARGDADGARPAFVALAADAGAPHWLRAGAYLYTARTDDLDGRRAAARQGYQKVVDDFDQERAAAAARIGLLTPYRRTR